MIALLAASIIAPQLSTEPLFTGWGDYHRPVDTPNVLARKYFDQGLGFFYAFNKGEAGRSFRQAAKLDPSFAMAWWGVALAHAPDINVPYIDPSMAKEAAEAIKNATKLEGGASPADRALIDAATKRFVFPLPKDQTRLFRNYALAMQKAHEQFPDDPDVTALTAEAGMILRPWDLWTLDRKPKPGTLDIVTTLENGLQVHPDHPFLNHLYIHALEASDHPERALPSADRLASLQPEMGHEVHMPSHIYVVVGQWDKAVDSNLAAIRVDTAYRKRRPAVGAYQVYMFHNRQMLTYAAMMSGQAKLAIRAAEELVSQIPPGIPEMFGDEIASIQVMPFDARKRFGKWRELLALPDFPAKFPAARALRAADRAVAYAALGQIAPARQELKLFAKYRSMVKPGGQPLFLNSLRQLLPIAEHFALGEVLTQEGNVAGGLSELRLAVKAEEQLRYDEPPTWLQPVRHTLGAALVRARRYEESLDVFNTDLVRHPHNGWSMYGKYQSLMGLKRTSDANATLAEFKKVWRQADHPIDSACLCLKPL